MWKTPVLIVNFKLYRQSSGKNAYHLLTIMDKLAEKYDVELVAALNPLDLSRFVDKVSIPLLLQHADAVEFGAHTGRINIELAKEYGASGLLINHSERRLTIADIEFLISRTGKMDMVSVVCSNNPKTSGALAYFKPDYIAMEPPELIGGDISVSKAKPETITETINAVNSVNQVPVLVGAGIKTGDDVKKAMELGAVGVLVASGVTKAQNPEKALENLIGGMI